MKVSLSIDQPSITPAEANVVDMLCETIKRDVDKLYCPVCQQDGVIILHINNSKISSLRTEIKGCCESFKKTVNEALAIGA